MQAKKVAIGRLYGIGVGPGDPELLTLRAHRILSRVPVIFVPQKDGKSRSYASQIIASLVKEPEQKIIELVFPMRKNAEELASYWEKATQNIWRHLSEGKDCAFIAEGDPLFYGTFNHVFAALQKGHPEVDIEVIPGISSVNAAAARALLPLASGDERVAILSTVYEDKAIREVLENFDTVVFLKISTALGRILNILEELNLTDKCIYVRRCTTADEEIIRDVKRIEGKKPDYFSMLIVRR
ncbi:MAG: precorrin-2 C(20)-methyltransferase [Chloroflexi bacterium]|nr:precorrin-2 C(20)-methyltransferase [Chloroflexota bacterium]